LIATVVVLVMQASCYGLPERMRGFIGMFYGCIFVLCSAKATSLTHGVVQMAARRLIVLRT
jgi:hypothetical protein